MKAGCPPRTSGGFVRASHDDDQVGARLGHHFRLQVATVHRLEVGDDGVVREPAVELLDGAQALGQQQRRAGLEPVHAGCDGRLGHLERLGEVGQVERDLDDRVLRCGTVRHRNRQPGLAQRRRTAR